MALGRKPDGLLESFETNFLQHGATTKVYLIETESIWMTKTTGKKKSNRA